MFTYIILALVISMISFLLMSLNYLLSMKKKNFREKLTPFECGFDPLCSARLPFSIQFFLISIIFLIFDVEIVIFFPLIPSFSFSFLTSFIIHTLNFIMILLFGLYMEWHDGALSWLK